MQSVTGAKRKAQFTTQSEAAVTKKRIRHEYDRDRIGTDCKYQLIQKLGAGSFGELYLGEGPSNEKVAIKIEKPDYMCKHNSQQLRHEYKVYRELVNCKGFCSVLFYGNFQNHNMMVMDLLHTSLEDRFLQSGNKFSEKTILQIADQLLERIETMHTRHLIHRDIKPANFVFGRPEEYAENVIFAIDFGLSKRYRDPQSLQHIPERRGRHLTGTPRYASINSHNGIEQSRRDDIESISYVLIYFFKGCLPWQGIVADSPQLKYNAIREKKKTTPVSVLCEGLPMEFAEMLTYARGLRFEQAPDYTMLRAKLKRLYNSRQYGGNDYSKKFWDWSS